MVKNPPENAGNAADAGLIPGSGRSPREGNGNPLQYSCLENPMDRGSWWATVHGVTRVRHNLATERPPVSIIYLCANKMFCTHNSLSWEHPTSVDLSLLIFKMSVGTDALPMWRLSILYLSVASRVSLHYADIANKNQSSRKQWWKSIHTL